MIFDKLKQFRQSAYTLLGRGKDAICDLMDAVLTSPRVNSFVELSLSPVFRREQREKVSFGSMKGLSLSRTSTLMIL